MLDSPRSRDLKCHVLSLKLVSRNMFIVHTRGSTYRESLKLLFVQIARYSIFD